VISIRHFILQIRISFIEKKNQKKRMKRKATEVVEFSYDLVVPILRREADSLDKEWVFRFDKS